MSTINFTFKPAAKPAPVRKTRRFRPRRPRKDPARLARMLALAHLVETEIAEGRIPDYTSAAAALGITRARLSQITALLMLAPQIQERVALGESGRTERELRRVSAEPDWDRQVALLSAEGAR
jgi:hypothetical protein